MIKLWHTLLVLWVVSGNVLPSTFAFFIPQLLGQYTLRYSWPLPENNVAFSPPPRSWQSAFVSVQYKNTLTLNFADSGNPSPGASCPPLFTSKLVFVVAWRRGDKIALKSTLLCNNNVTLTKIKADMTLIVMHSLAKKRSESPMLHSIWAQNEN